MRRKKIGLANEELASDSSVYEPGHEQLVKMYEGGLNVLCLKVVELCYHVCHDEGRDTGRDAMGAWPQ